MNRALGGQLPGDSCSCISTPRRRTPGAFHLLPARRLRRECPHAPDNLDGSRKPIPWRPHAHAHASGGGAQGSSKSNSSLARAVAAAVAQPSTPQPASGGESSRAKGPAPHSGVAGKHPQTVSNAGRDPGPPPAQVQPADVAPAAAAAAAAEAAAASSPSVATKSKNGRYEDVPKGLPRVPPQGETCAASLQGSRC